jgi:NADH:ubiquinone oxidoreductase subunit 6 (subunit J)
VAATFWHSFFFLVFAMAACGFALAVVLSSNVVRMAFYLVMSLGATAGLFFLAGAPFVAAMQLMVYVGGTLVLLIFGVMLTARGPFVQMAITPGQWALAAIVGASLLAVLLQAAFSVKGWNSAVSAADRPALDSTPVGPIGLGLLGVRADRLDEEDAVLRAGMSGYLLAFEVISVHLVAVLIGAAYLARPRRKTPENQ